MEAINAVKKVWNMPEVVGRLISLLDPASVLHLVQSEVLSKETLQESLTSKAWIKIIGRISYDDHGYPGHKGSMKGEDVKDLVEIVKKMEPKKTRTFLLPLLDLVCEHYADSDFNVINISCPCSHSLTTSRLMVFCFLRMLRAPLGQQSKASSRSAHTHSRSLCSRLSTPG